MDIKEFPVEAIKRVSATNEEWQKYIETRYPGNPQVEDFEFYKQFIVSKKNVNIQ